MSHDWLTARADQPILQLFLSQHLTPKTLPYSDPDYHVSQKKRAPKNTDKYGAITKHFKQSSLVYVFNCHIVYLSLAKTGMVFIN